MKHSKAIIIAASSAGIIGFAGIGASVMAATNSGGGSSNYPSIVQKIADKFNLDPAKVNDVFVADRASHQAEHQAKLKSTLDQAVKDGKITKDQEDKLIAKLQSLHTENKDNKAQNRQDLKSELDQWAKDNGITNLSDLLPQPPAGGMRHMGEGPDDSTSSN